MSSTNRSSARDSHLADYYVTPLEPIRSFLDKFCEDENIDLSTISILDPCAGWNPRYETLNEDGTIKVTKANPMSYPTVLTEKWAKYISTNDLRKDSPATYNKDFLSLTLIPAYNMVITNPPFNIAEDIIKKALTACFNWWYVIMLLRLNYFGSKARQEFWKNNMPIRTYIHTKRIWFTDDWKTDSIEYMHCVWKKGENPKEVKLSLLYDF